MCIALFYTPTPSAPLAQRGCAGACGSSSPLSWAVSCQACADGSRASLAGGRQPKRCPFAVDSAWIPPAKLAGRLAVQRIAAAAAAGNSTAGVPVVVGLAAAVLVAGPGAETALAAAYAGGQRRLPRPDLASTSRAAEHGIAEQTVLPAVVVVAAVELLSAAARQELLAVVGRRRW